MPRYGSAWHVAVQLLVAFSAASCRSSSTDLTGPGPVTRCGASVTVSASQFGAEGGEGAVSVSTERECQWRAESDAGWIAIAPHETMQGSGTVPFVVSATGDPVARTASLTVLEERIPIAQRAAACQYQLSTVALAIAASGGTVHVDVTASSALCEWTASSSAAWATITSGRSYRGNGRVSVQAAAWSGPPRRAEIAIGGVTVALTQSDGCAFNVSPGSATLPAAAGRGTIAVQTGEGCGWSAVSAVPWIRITEGAAGAGAGAAQFIVDENVGPARSATITVANRAVSINQASGCAYQLAPPSASFAAAGAAGAVTLQTVAGCTWTAGSEAAWIAIGGTTAGSGPGLVQLQVAANAGPERTGSVRIGPHRFTATQASGCTYALNETRWPFYGEGQVGWLFLTTGAECPWSVSSQVEWIRVVGSPTRIGPGDISFVVDPNPGVQREGTLNIGGVIFTAVQYPAGGGN